MKRISTLILLLVFSFAIMPKEVFHLLHDHEETIHRQMSCHSQHLEVKHEHCELFKFTQVEFSVCSEIVYSKISILLNTITPGHYNFVKQNLRYLFSLKAPPSIIA